YIHLYYYKIKLNKKFLLLVILGLGSKEVDFQTYLDLVSHKVMLKADKEELRTAFNVLDRYGNGKVLVSDLKHILCNIGEKLTVSYIN
ncbi:unnamed protein product, partial [Cryptosporidium hominis]